MVHPKPKDENREALFGYLIGRDYDFEVLPEIIREFETYKTGKNKKTPNV